MNKQSVFVFLRIATTSKMTMKIKKIIPAFIFSIILISCEKEKENPCMTVVPPSPIINFTLMDSTTGKSLIGPDRLYHPDTITKLNSEPYNFIYNLSDSILVYNFGHSKSGENQPYRLNRTEYDTLNVEFEVVEGECFTYNRLNQFYYNGELIEDNGYLRIIEK